MTLEDIENEIYWFYRNKTEDIIRVVGRDAYLRKPVRVMEVGVLAQLWAAADAMIQEEAA